MGGLKAKNMHFQELKELLDQKAAQYNQPAFIETDPIQIPRQFAQKENIEIAGFLAATIAWGQRPTIIKNAFQFGFSYLVSDRFTLDAVYHHGDSAGKTTGQILNPMFIQNFPPYGAIPGSEVSYDMTTDMVMVGFSYKFRSMEKINPSTD